MNQAEALCGVMQRPLVLAEKDGCKQVLCAYDFPAKSQFCCCSLTCMSWPCNAVPRVRPQTKSPFGAGLCPAIFLPNRQTECLTNMNLHCNGGNRLDRGKSNQPRLSKEVHMLYILKL